MGLGMEKLDIPAARKNADSILLETPTNTAGTGSATPFSLNTPDILNSLINITNPFFPATTTTTTTPSSSNPSNGNDQESASEASTPDHEKKTFVTLESSSGVAPPASPPPPPLTSVKSMRTQLIKEGLKLTIQSKRKRSGKEELDVKKELLEAKREHHSRSEELTPEDEDRRRRRRERNKVAATKCRNKKKEKTVLLAQESESLEGNVLNLKTEISKLEIEKQRLMEVLAQHARAPSCKKRFVEFNQNNYNQGQPPQQQQQLNFNNYFPSAAQGNQNGLINQNQQHQQRVQL